MSKAKSLWKGPEKDGITQSMLNDFIACRERFRIKYVLGLREEDSFSHRLEYGNMFHLCEQYYRRGDDWKKVLWQYAKDLCAKYKGSQEQVVHWHDVCKTQFPIYVAFWKKMEQKKKQKSIFTEQVFAVPYELPSKRVVLLRGKWDGCNLRGNGLWLDEHKTKGDIKEGTLQRQLLFDLQAMTYLVAFAEYIKQGNLKLPKGAALEGFTYNVVRRPLSGGKHSISQLKPSKSNPKGESKEQFYGRLGERIQEDAAWFFMRWDVTVTSGDIQKFKSQCLNPLLEQVCDWWQWIEAHGSIEGFNKSSEALDGMLNSTHYRTPYGIYNPIAEGGSTYLDDYIDTGSTLGLQKATKLFTELQDD